MRYFAPFGGALITATLLAGCGGSQPTVVGASSALSPATRTQKGMRAALLYVSNQNNNTVSVFTYPGGKLRQTLSGFDIPSGLCSDKTGDVWIVNHGSGRIMEYEHGADEPILTLSDSGKSIVSCSVDPVTGDLAVTNFTPEGGNRGSVSIYKSAQGSPRIYKDKLLFRDWYCAYDDQGNLFVDGTSDLTSGFELAELSHGAAKFTNVTLDQAMSAPPGGLQWNGTDIAIGDVNSSKETVVYEFAVNGSVGTTVSSTVLSRSAYVPREFWIDPATGRIVAPSRSARKIGYWRFPQGGAPTKTIMGLDIPAAVAISD